MDALTAQTRSIERVVAALDLSALEFEGSDSLDNGNCFSVTGATPAYLSHLNGTAHAVPSFLFRIHHFAAAPGHADQTKGDILHSAGLLRLRILCSCRSRSGTHCPITVPTTDFSSPEKYETMQAGVATHRKGSIVMPSPILLQIWL